MSTAPDFYRNYPSGGEVISWAWQTAWDHLADCMTTRADLQDLMAKTTPCAHKTASNLISKALRYGLLVKVDDTYDSGAMMLCRTDVLKASNPDHPALKAVS